MAGGKATTLLDARTLLGAALRGICRLSVPALLLVSVAMVPVEPIQAQPRAGHSKAAVAPKPDAKPAKAAPRRQKSAEPARRAADAENTNGFNIDGRRVRVDVVKAETDLLGPDGRAPAVLILHGAHGLGDGSLFYPQAKALAERGINAFVVHYFDGIPQARKAAPTLHDERERVIAEAVSYVQKQAYVDGERIGVFGLSLGGFHALSLGSRDARIQAVVNVVGAMPSEVQRRGVHRMPPTLVLHGDRDATVPVRRAYELASLLGEIGAEHEVKIYKGQGHTFRGDAKEDSISRTVDFFERYLGGDRGLLDRELEIDIALAPVVPETETLPIRELTIADEALWAMAEHGTIQPGN
ncbi:MAG: alpha/beta hydrolase family protein [Ferrovibrio sp.]|jgi:dienelactone hydrolase|uniref:alpha/beta hydrolase family protein n=1 Tax=Ferrovibrio sp. TaxID=1917215 RepID=UPI00391DDA3C